MASHTTHDAGITGTNTTRFLGALILTLCTLLYALLAGTVAVAGEREGQIAVTGRGEVQLVPDQATLQLTMSRRGQDITAMREDLDDQVSALIEQLTNLQVAEKDISSTRINIQPVYRYDQKQQKRVNEGYEVTRTVSLMLRQLGALEKIIADATNIGVNHISPPALSSSRREVAYREALGLAVKQARERAEVIAKAAGVELKGVSSVSAGDSPSFPVPVARMAMAADAESSSYQAGEMTVVANVSVVFELED